MTIDDFLGYKLICKMSSDLKSEGDYSDKEFSIVISTDSKSDSGYTAVVSGTDSEDMPFENDWDGEDVAKKLMFGTWDIIKRHKL